MLEFALAVYDATFSGKPNVQSQSGSFGTMVEVRIGKASLDDLPRFAEMELESGTWEFINSYSVSEHHTKFDDPQIIYLRITGDDRLIGFFILALEPGGERVEFRRVVVSEKGQGIGQAAIRQMEAFCKEELARSSIWLDVLEENHRGQHIYEKLGYTRFGERKIEDHRLFLYEKSI